jgi:hypothetical protein
MLVTTADVAFPDKKHTISKLCISRFTTGTRTEELSNTPESFEMKATNFKGFLWPVFAYHQ